MGGARSESEWGRFLLVIVIIGCAGWILAESSRRPVPLNAKPAAARAPAVKPLPPPPPPARAPARTRTFARSPCTYDCSGHQAGYAWAEKHGIDDPDDCGGNSQSFIEGCEEYAEEQAPSPPLDEDEDQESTDEAQ